MSDNKISFIPDNAVTEISKEIYSDVAHPALKEVGKIGESIMKMVALPFKFLGMTTEQIELKYSEFLQKTIKKVSEEKRVIPKAVVAAPLLDHVKFVFNENGLSEMFSNLLANAMDENIEKMVHPAFVEMLKQMSPLDVEFLNIYFDNNDIVEISDITWSRGDLQKSLTVDSLSRLGVIKSISYDNIDDIALSLTDFGRLFRNLCMLKPSEISFNESLSTEDVSLDDDYVNSDEIGLSFSDSFGTARISDDGEKLYIRSSFEMEDVWNGSNIIILFRISNIEKKAKTINSVYLDCGSKKHILPQTTFPITISPKSYFDFAFVMTDTNKLLQYALKERTKYVIQEETIFYDLPITNGTKKEIKLFLKYTEKGEDE